MWKPCRRPSISGISPRPVYLRVEHGRVALFDAQDIWGQDTLTSERALIEQNGGTGVWVACNDACPVDDLAVAFNRETADRRARPFLAQPRECIACRFCELKCSADAVTMKPLSQITDLEKLIMDGGFQE